ARFPWGLGVGMRLVLVRHGQTPSNVAGLLDTAPPGPGLTDLGRAQAAAVAEAMRPVAVEAVFSSHQLRAEQTLAPLAGQLGLDPVVLPGLREVSAGDLEMASDVDSVHRYIGAMWQWLDGDLSARIPGGPDGYETMERYDAGVA